MLDHEDKTVPKSATLRAVAVYAPGKAERDHKARARALSRIDRRLGEIAQKVGQRRYKDLSYAQGRVQDIFQSDLRQYRGHLHLRTALQILVHRPPAQVQFLREAPFGPPFSHVQMPDNLSAEPRLISPKLARTHDLMAFSLAGVTWRAQGRGRTGVMSLG